MASLDRQALLEQKRKRLQELKERRMGVSQVDATLPNLALSDPHPDPHPDPQPARPRVDFAVQVDLIKQPLLNLPATILNGHEGLDQSTFLSANGAQVQVQAQVQAQAAVPDRPIIKFDKIVQTHFELLDDEALDPPKSEDVSLVLEQPLEPASASPEPVETHDVGGISEKKVELAISEFLVDSGFRFSDLRLGIQSEKIINTDIVAPFNVTKSVVGFVNRPIVDIAMISDHPDVFLVAYGKPPLLPRPKKSKTSKKRPLPSSAGLAVLFNKSGGSIVPEFFLECTGCINKIMFDKTNPFKIFAGLQNGRVVMWDLSGSLPTQVAVLPTLQTSTVVSSAAKSEHKFIHHIAPIVLLTQIHTASSLSSGILSICRDGVVNLWLPNFLAFPKISSMRLRDPEQALKVPFRLAGALFVLTVLRGSHLAGHVNPPEFNFLNLTLVASQTGVIYKLINDKDKAFIKSKLVDKYVAGSVSAGGINCVAELKYNATKTYIISAHPDWCLRLWDVETGKLRHMLPTTSFITRIVVRPGHGGQFITIATMKPPTIGLFVEFWDINAKLLSPISTIPTREKKAGSALFNADGSEMVLAYDDGEIDIFSIEEALVAAQVQSQRYASVDDGAERLLSSV